ncbi:MAG: hypothetical protein ACK46Q_11815 [Hyphomonas sp.]
MPQPITSLKTVLKLRLLSLAAFPAGAFLLAILQRSPFALGILAATMLAVSLYERRRLAGIAGIPAVLRPAQLAMGFAFRLGLLIGVFVLTLGVLALFRDTSLAREITLLDAGIAALTAAIALIANEISARMAGPGLAGMRTELSAAFHRQGEGNVEGIVIEGEVIDPDEPKPR